MKLDDGMDAAGDRVVECSPDVHLAKKASRRPSDARRRRLPEVRAELEG
jgi:hypothetical protein